MTNVLVTGGAGYVGSHVCKAIAGLGLIPVSLDNLSNGRAELAKFGPLVEADILDKAAISEAMATYDPIAVFHLAALAYVGESVARPDLYYRTNVAGTLNLIEAMSEASVKMLVFSSSCSTYGTPQSIPVNEDELQQPVSPYGASKLMAERLIKDIGKQAGFSWAIFRYFNAAGADPDREIGESHDPETHIIPLAFEAAQGTLSEFTMFGDDYETADGTCVRDYVHVTDLADAHVRALDHLRNGGQSLALNLGSGRGHSVQQVLKEVEAVTGFEIPVSIAPRREGDADSLYADPSRAKASLGWTAKHSDLKTIVRTAWNWHVQQTNGTKSRCVEERLMV